MTFTPIEIITAVIAAILFFSGAYALIKIGYSASTVAWQTEHKLMAVGITTIFILPASVLAIWGTEIILFAIFGIDLQIYKLIGV